jgi:hypothetical protein
MEAIPVLIENVIANIALNANNATVAAPAASKFRNGIRLSAGKTLIERNIHSRPSGTLKKKMARQSRV